MHGRIRFPALALSLAMALGMTTATPELARADTAGARQVAFDPNSHPYGRSMQEWYRDWWRWAIAIPFDRHPSLDPTGARCTADQNDRHAWLLGAQGTFTSVDRSCTVPARRAVALGLSVYLNDYPCPDPGFEPAPGQTLEEFLTEGARQTIDTVDALTLTVDGTAVPNVFSHRTTTPLFTFTGDVSMRQLDPCITGTPQQAVADGYFVLLKPMKPGVHTVVWTVHHTFGYAYTVRYTLTVR